MDIEELKQLVAAKLDADEILDLLGWTTYDLVEVLQEHIEAEFLVFQEAVV